MSDKCSYRVFADKSVNVDEAKKVGQNIIEKISGKQVSQLSFKKKEQAVLMNDSSCVKIDEDEVYVDPQLLFQRLISAAHGSIPVDDLDSFFSYELCTYPPSLFENVHLLRESRKSGLATDIQKTSQVDFKTVLRSEYVHHVLDGGSLITRITWPRGRT